MLHTFNFDQIKVLITSVCNSNCTHCRRHFDKNNFIISESKLVEIVDFAVANSTSSFSFSGGEFFTHPFAYGLLDYCFSKKIKVKVLTNAKELDLSFFEKCQDLSLLSMQVSIDGLKKNHDLRRGNGSFDATIHNVARLKELGIPITANMALDERNYTDIVDVLELPYFSDFILLPVGYAGAAKTQGILNKDINADRDYENIIRLIYKKKATFEDKNHRCGMFPDGIAISYDGRVYPCATAREYGVLCMGNISNRSLEETIQSYIDSEKSKIVSEYVSNDISECNHCLSRRICNRGCRVRAYKFHGRLSAPDPFCCKIFNNDFSDISIGCVFWGEKGET